MFNLESLMSKIETTLFSTLYVVAISLSIFGALTDNIEALKNSDEIVDLSKNRRDVELVNEYYNPEFTITLNKFM